MKTNTFENPKKIKFDEKSIYYLMHQLYDIILSSPKGIIEQFSVNVLLFFVTYCTFLKCYYAKGT